MKELMLKEACLSASPLSWIFIAFALMTMIPGYPIVLGAFFVCLGLFQTFQSGRENNDVLYTVLLPVPKQSAVKAKFLFVGLIETLAFLGMFLLTMIRMLFMNDVGVYVQNAMMNANPYFLACVLIVFSLFNTVFVGGFYRTAYKFGKPFVLFGILGFVWILIVETLHHIPGLEFLNRTDAVGDIRLWIILVIAMIWTISSSVISCMRACRRFEEVDL